MDEMGFFVSQNLHHDAITNIFYAPMSFFDTTVRLVGLGGCIKFLIFWLHIPFQPAGRILSVFGKDIDSTLIYFFYGSRQLRLPLDIDNQLPVSMRLCMSKILPNPSEIHLSLSSRSDYCECYRFSSHYHRTRTLFQ